VPRDAVDDRAADQRAEGDAEAGDARPRADRQPALLGGEDVGEQGQRQRGHDRGADALDAAGGDQRRGRGRECRSGRGRREHREPDHEHAPAPEPITERGSGQQQNRVRQRVRVDRPLQRLDRGAEVGADGRQCGGDDQVVEHDHEQRDRHDRERPTRATILL
jgi:hypothetical protein